MSAPGRHPLPPADLGTRNLPITKFSGPWFRTHASSRAALFFGKLGRNRFDAPAAEYGVLYVARKQEGAFIETFGHDTGRHRVLDVKELEDRALSRIDVSRPLRLVDLRAEGLARLGADAELLTGAYGLSQAWSLALHEHPAHVDGIAYLARHDLSQTCAALFDRAKSVISARLLGSYADVALEPVLARLLDRYDYGIA